MKTLLLQILLFVIILSFWANTLFAQSITKPLADQLKPGQIIRVVTSEQTEHIGELIHLEDDLVEMESGEKSHLLTLSEITPFGLNTVMCSATSMLD